MRTRRLGHRGPEFSTIGFGAWEAGKGADWGTPPPDEQILESIRTTLDAGINWIDTAEIYGGGTSEDLVGRAVTGRRHEVLLATKVAPEPEGTGFRPEQVAEACRGSLRRLGVEHIDLYQLHWRDDGVPVEETWGAMDALVDQGLVRWLGVSNFDRELIERCLAIRHVDSLQQEFSMLVRQHAELIAWCGERGVGVVTYGPLAYGLLTGAIDMETSFAPGDFRSGDDEDDTEVYDELFAPAPRRRALDLVEGLSAIAERLGCSVAQLALAWNVHQPGVTSAIAGSRDPAHVRANAEAGDLGLDDATLGELDALLPRAG